MPRINQQGQTLIEVLIALTVGVLILGALVIATIVSIRNAQFSQNQLQATKFAQEGIDLVRTIRNRNLKVESASPPFSTFIDLWTYSPGFGSCGYVKLGSCTNNAFLGYFKIVPDAFNPTGKLIRGNTITEVSETVGGQFSRFILIEDQSSPVNTRETEKKITVIVRWKDTSGNHESNIQTILTRQ
jgi:type II secretory pathway pseudopilin PulG